MDAVGRTKLSRIRPLQVVDPNTDLDAASRELLAEMETEWEKDWSEITAETNNLDIPSNRTPF